MPLVQRLYNHHYQHEDGSLARRASFSCGKGSFRAQSTTMWASRVFLQRSTRIILFTRANCTLCDESKLVLSTVWNKKPVDYHETNVMARGQRQWKDLYKFDTPVLRLPGSPRTVLPRRGMFSTTAEVSEGNASFQRANRLAAYGRRRKR